MLILNTGGTFNKRYNKINGELEVPYDNYAIEKILESFTSQYSVAGVIYKDSLDIDTNDRKMLTSIIMESVEDTFLIVHGTDTMHESAEFLSTIFTNKKIVFTGSMKPFEIDTIESTLNLGVAIGFLKSLEKYGVYICMNGNVESWDKIEKNRQKGKFELV
ncbi:MAG: L-asparaginase [Sulfurimonas sp.]|jgi:L-asparaginase|uniref:asparaginase domain-containing protein n=1 Tax=Sulfurimonas sp. TaxID=2022749 RepID=UPI0039E5168C